MKAGDERNDHILFTSVSVSDIGSTDASRSLTCSHSLEKQERPIAWQKACYYKYCLGRCDDRNCKAIHDLPDETAAKFKEWAQAQKHSVWRSSEPSREVQNGQDDSDDEDGDDENGAEHQQEDDADDQPGEDEKENLQQLNSTAKDARSRRRKTKLRPCKGKRDRYRKLVDRMVSLVDEKPNDYNLEDLQIPPSVMANERLLRKFTARTEKHAADVREHLVNDQNDPSEPKPKKFKHCLTVDSQDDANNHVK